MQARGAPADLNDAAGLNIHSAEFGQKMTAGMEAALQHATPYTLEMWQARSWGQKLGELLIRPLESQLHAGPAVLRRRDRPG